MGTDNNNSFKVGFGFGIASGVITTLGLMIGLYSSTLSRSVVIGGILTIAIADSFSDALGIHLSVESEGNQTTRVIWLSTIYTFLSKLFVTLSFLPLVIFLKLDLGIFGNIIWGFFLISVYSFAIAKRQNNNPIKAILEHSLIMTFVIIATFYTGKLISHFF
ncbi:MAG: hypothetical protein JXA94_02570 [Parachlamydiales bacterium]|nr:hypothetical protein [Parachlamydiales bacterium]